MVDGRVELVPLEKVCAVVDSTLVVVDIIPVDAGCKLLVELDWYGVSLSKMVDVATDELGIAGLEGNEGMLFEEIVELRGNEVGMTEPELMVDVLKVNVPSPNRLFEDKFALFERPL